MWVSVTCSYSLVTNKIEECVLYKGQSVHHECDEEC